MPDFLSNRNEGEVTINVLTKSKKEGPLNLCRVPTVGGNGPAGYLGPFESFLLFSVVFVTDFLPKIC